ncbi:MAG: hypothetical protein KF768_14675 [Phycisphaeraceae bacterium]|nr:hypothetical protein [Phycisphaeraceae bacterium]
MTEFEEYESLRRSGSSAVEVYCAARSAGMNDIDAIRMLRTVFGLSLGEAKEAMLVGSGVADSLEDHEDALADGLRKGRRDTH